MECNVLFNLIYQKYYHYYFSIYQDKIFKYFTFFSYYLKSGIYFTSFF